MKKPKAKTVEGILDEMLSQYPELTVPLKAAFAVIEARIKRLEERADADRERL